MKKILVALDLGRPGGNDEVLKTASKLAKTFDAEQELLFVMEPSTGFVVAVLPDGLLQERRNQAEADLAEIAEQQGATAWSVRDGGPAAEIMAQAEKSSADLIIMHSHDPDVSNFFLGSTASRVVRHAHCSVHIVRHAE